jgi:two-component system, OmpR family, response regulator
MLRILLVEDSAVLAERISELLQQIEGVQVVGTAADEASAVALARSQAVDVMILDLQLRTGTGFGVLRSLGRTRPAVVVLTNYALPEYKRRAQELGVEHFLNKSQDYERLPEVIQSLRSVEPD